MNLFKTGMTVFEQGDLSQENLTNFVVHMRIEKLSKADLSQKTNLCTTSLIPNNNHWLHTSVTYPMIH